MIRYTLKCSEGHRFESWFQSADAFDTLQSKGLVACSLCGSEDVSKAMMAPPVPKKGRDAVAAPNAGPLSAPVSEAAGEAEAMMRKMREHVDKNSTYVGGSFAREARAMHLGDRPERAIHGEANAQEAKALIEDGVPILPLPGPPPEKAN